MACSVVVSASCNDIAGPLPSNQNGPRLEFVDGRNGGTSGFYFLPPLAPAVPYSGTFDPGRTPRVIICRIVDDSCGPIVASFSTEGSGATAIRVDSASEQYAVQWHTRSAGVRAGETYRVNVIEGASELGHADIRIVARASDARALSDAFVPIVAGATLPIKFRISLTSMAPAVRLEIEPSTFILPGNGSTKQLVARAYDSNGNLTAAQVTWTTSAPGTIAVDGNGVATAEAASGSAQITAQSGSAVSAPALGVVMQPPAGTLLVDDANVIGSIQAVDSAAVYAPGWRYRAILAGVVPAIGQLVLSTGDAPIGGRIVSVTPAGGNYEVVIELVPMSELFGSLSLNETIELVSPPTTNLTAVQSGFAAFRGLGKRLPTSSSLLESETEFDLGPFECKVTSQGPSLTPTLESFSFHADPDLSLEIEYQPVTGLEKLVVRGSVDAGISVKPVIPLDVEEKIECKTQVATIHLPIGGPLSLFIGGEVPVGVGFEFGGKIVGANVGIDAGVTIGASVAIGFDCTSVCAAVTEVSGSRNGFIKPVLPVAESSGRLELGGSAFGWAEMKVGNPILELLQFKAFEAKVGLSQKFDLANKSVQVADTAYASKAELTFDTEAGTSTDLAGFLALVGVQLPELKLSHSSGLAVTPRLGSFTIAPDTVAIAPGGTSGDSATFILSVDSVSYLGVYAIDSIELFRKQPDAGSFVLESVPVPCARIAPTPGQSAFSCRTLLPEDWEGTQDVYAFVKARVFGVPLPPLELSENAKAQVTVEMASVTVSPGSATLESGETQAFTAVVTGLNSQSVVWTATGGTITTSGVYTAGDVAGSFLVVATSAVNSSIADTAEVTVDASSSPIAVEIDPDSVTLVRGTTRQFTASVTGTANQDVAWTATGGTLTVSNNVASYTAGQTAGNYQIRAQSLADTTKSDIAQIRIIGDGRIVLLTNPVDLQAAAAAPSGSPATIDTASNPSTNLQDFTRSVTASASGSWPAEGPTPAGSGSGSGNGSHAVNFLLFDATALSSISSNGNASASGNVSGSRGAGGSGSAWGSLTFQVLTSAVDVTVTYGCQASGSGQGSGNSSFGLRSLSIAWGIGASCNNVTGSAQFTQTVTLAPGVYRLERGAEASAPTTINNVTSVPSSAGSANFTLSLEFKP